MANILKIIINSKWWIKNSLGAPEKINIDQVDPKLKSFFVPNAQPVITAWLTMGT